MAKSLLCVCALCALVAPAMGAMIDPFDIQMEYNIVPETGDSVYVEATGVEAGESGYLTGTNQVWSMDSSVAGEGVESFVLTILRANNTQMLPEYLVNLVIGDAFIQPSEDVRDVDSDFIILEDSIEVEFAQGTSPVFTGEVAPLSGLVINNPTMYGWGIDLTVLPENQTNITTGTTDYVTGVQIRFDVQAVPEPVSLAMLACGSLLVLRRRK